ncbi:hypothetical protein TrRE_jg4298 [Triparma retinervis]|uniref:MATE efflux family protein n=1 Tax=Triparma retinervis TaxID=2557542 RepID=A0A9W6Z5X1_9STRA|nr:hypothetical protein TrRE_jg4298 [Triparma retinervis]
MMEALVDLSRRQKGKGDWTLDSVRASQMPTSWRKINIGSPRRGVAITGGYALGKIVGDPVLRCCISLVASSSGDSRKLSVNVTVALLLALTIGVAQGAFYLANSGGILTGLGVPVTSPMHGPALSYMMVRGFALPASMLWLVANGVYRGIGDTVTPLIWSVVFTLLNVVLDPIFMAPFVQSLKSYISASSLVCVRSTLKVSTYAYTSRLSALLGPLHAAAYNLCFQIGFVTTQCCESIAVATQTLLAREFGRGEGNVRGRYVRRVVRESCAAGGALALGLSALTYLNRQGVIGKLTSDPAVRSLCHGIFPAVLVCQAMKGLAYPANGVVMGGSDWTYSMVTMGAANVVATGMLGAMGRRGEVGLKGIWWCLAGFMGTQVAASLLRVTTP